MKITKAYLKQIIKEELTSLLESTKDPSKYFDDVLKDDITEMLRELQKIDIALADDQTGGMAESGRQGEVMANPQKDLRQAVITATQGLENILYALEDIADSRPSERPAEPESWRDKVKKTPGSKRAMLQSIEDARQDISVKKLDGAPSAPAW